MAPAVACRDSLYIARSGTSAAANVTLSGWSQFRQRTATGHKPAASALLYVVWCILYVVCCALHVVAARHVARSTLHAGACCMCRMAAHGACLNGACCRLHGRLLRVACVAVHVAQPTLRIAYRTSDVACYACMLPRTSPQPFHAALRRVVAHIDRGRARPRARSHEVL